jgi:molybdopterin-guanine dinucleotide biosynthesis adapter protein
LIGSSPSTPAEAKISQTGCRALAVEGPVGPAKTALIAALIAWFAAQGRRPAVARFSHEFEPGDAGKDTWKFRRAGANPVALAAPGLCQITRRFSASGDAVLAQALAALTPPADLILVEGFDRSPLPRVILLAPGASFDAREDAGVIALVSSDPVRGAIPSFRPRQIPELGRHILSRLSGGF